MKEQLPRYVPLIIILLVAIIMAALVKDFVREVIVIPFLYVVWGATLILRSFPDSFFWAIFLLVAIVIALRSLLRETEPKRGGARDHLDLGGPVATWSRLIDHAQEGGYSQWQLSQSLLKLTISLLRDQQERSMKQVERYLHQENLDLPSPVRSYFEAGLLPYQPISTLKRRLQVKPMNTPLDLDPVHVVDYLEEKLDPLSGETR